MKVLLLVALMAGAVLCDLPVHCMRHQIAGKWKLYVEKPQAHGMGPLSCGHSVPDNEKTSFKAGWQDFRSDWSLDMELGGDYVVRRNGDSAQGKWTMVYDEGFEVNYKNVNYFAFSKYEPDGGKNAKSLCDETLIGWYYNHDNGDRGCYHAVKDEKLESTQSLDQISVVQPEFMDKSQINQLSMVQINDKVEKIMSLEDHQEIVDQINQSGAKWEAKVYDQLVGLSLTELNRKLGRKKYYQGPRSTQVSKGTSFIQTSDSYKHYDTQDLSDLPSSFDWSQYLKEPRQQEQCGSCYAIATMAMLSARLRKQGEQATLSPQHSLNCNYYNQGCDGGYPFLVSRWAQEDYLVTEDAVPYTGKDGQCDRGLVDGLSKAYGVKEYKYIGGGYGLSNEKAIMKEIYNNGPIVMNFEPTFEFMYYSKGVYHSKDAAEWILDHEDRPEWEKVDHSVLCFGWGEDNGEKYWLLQNSWGNEWGENGNFRMRRGTDESAIESMAEAAVPYVIDKTPKQSKSNNDSNNESEQSNFLDDLETLNKKGLFSFSQQKQYLRKNE